MSLRRARSEVEGIGFVSDDELREWRRRLLVDLRFDPGVRETLDDVEREVAHRRRQGGGGRPCLTG